jgi:hypothetical protein
VGSRLGTVTALGQHRQAGALAVELGQGHQPVGGPGMVALVTLASKSLPGRQPIAITG